KRWQPRSDAVNDHDLVVPTNQVGVVEKGKSIERAQPRRSRAAADRIELRGRRLIELLHVLDETEHGHLAAILAYAEAAARVGEELLRRAALGKILREVD